MYYSFTNIELLSSWRHSICFKLYLWGFVNVCHSISISLSFSLILTFHYEVYLFCPHLVVQLVCLHTPTQIRLIWFQFSIYLLTLPYHLIVSTLRPCISWPYYLALLPFFAFISVCLDFCFIVVSFIAFYTYSLVSSFPLHPKWPHSLLPRQWATLATTFKHLCVCVCVCVCVACWVNTNLFEQTKANLVDCRWTHHWLAMDHFYLSPPTV